MVAKKGRLPRVAVSLYELCDADPQTSTQRPNDHAEGGAGFALPVAGQDQ